MNQERVGYINKRIAKLETKKAKTENRKIIASCYIALRRWRKILAEGDKSCT